MTKTKKALVNRYRLAKKLTKKKMKDEFPDTIYVYITESYKGKPIFAATGNAADIVNYTMPKETICVYHKYLTGRVKSTIMLELDKPKPVKKPK